MLVLLILLVCRPLAYRPFASLPAAAALAAAAMMTLAMTAVPAAAADLSPMRAAAERVVDGDTVRVRVAVWLDQELRVAVRLADVDAPEMFRPRCDDERAKGEAAKAFVEAFLKGREVMLHDIRRSKYAGRVAARIEADGRDLGAALRAAGLGSAAGDAAGGARWCSGPES